MSSFGNIRDWAAFHGRRDVNFRSVLQVFGSWNALFRSGLVFWRFIGLCGGAWISIFPYIGPIDIKCTIRALHVSIRSPISCVANAFGAGCLLSGDAKGGCRLNGMCCSAKLGCQAWAAPRKGCVEKGREGLYRADRRRWQYRRAASSRRNEAIT